MVDTPSQSSRPSRHDRGLVLIAIFKFAQALLFLAIGVGARRMLHKDVGDELATLADHLRFNPESRLVNFVLDKASLLDDPLLRRIGLAALCYAAVGIAEGIGLYLEKTWGEFLTLAITISFLPLEIWEIVRRLTWIRASLLAINILVFSYILKLIVDKERQRRSSRARETANR